jgi:hypothetical protein
MCRAVDTGLFCAVVVCSRTSFSDPFHVLEVNRMSIHIASAKALSQPCCSTHTGQICKLLILSEFFRCHGNPRVVLTTLSKEPDVPVSSLPKTIPGSLLTIGQSV